ALRQARASRQVTASSTYVLLRDRALPAPERPLSFLLATAVYGAPGTPDAGEFRGWLLLAMRAADFIHETLRTSARDAVTVTLTDLSTGAPTIVATIGNTPSSDAGLRRERRLTVGQRTWYLLVEPTPQLLGVTDRNLPAVTGGIGLLLTVLIGALVDARRRALHKVTLATASLHADIAKREKVEAQLRLRERELQQLALHDALTGLSNRTLFHERLGHALLTHRRNAGALAVLFIDLDGFKQVNDRYGHGGGDTILTTVADRLRQCVRVSDTVARFGGDEFAILAERLTASDDVEIIAGRVVHALQAPFDINGESASVGCSVGVAVHEDDDHTAEDLLRDADAAMYAAKTAGKNRYHLAVTASPETRTAASRSAP
ncbi:MAG TPA: sensor domain-containing diguanylate cyclase, partial [Actinoplanes sp.]